MFVLLNEVKGLKGKVLYFFFEIFMYDWFLCLNIVWLGLFLVIILFLFICL